MITSSNFFSIDLAAPKASKGTTGAIIDVDSYWKLTPLWKVRLAHGLFGDRALTAGSRFRVRCRDKNARYVDAPTE